MANPLSPTTAAPPGQPPQTPSGLQALAAAGLAILGVVTALFPNAPVLAALTTALPQLKVAIPIVLTSVGSIWAAASHPPALLKR